jgi:Pentapeptide repeats (8 copies)
MKGMANPEHLAKLKEGVEAWNEWRLKNPGIQPDLQGANLIFAQLQEATLMQAQLQEATLVEAQLQEADLSGAFFDNATILYEVILGDDKYGVASFADVSWGGVNLAVVDWSSLKMLGDEYEARRSTYAKEMKKNKAQHLEDYRIAVRANRQLAVALRDQGLNEDADRFAYRAQVLQRKVLWKQKQFGRGFFSGFLALVAGYGYRMERILFTYAIAVSLFAVAYFVLGMYYEPHLSFLDAVLTSVTAFHGRVFAEPFLHSGEPQLWVTAFEAIVGLVVEGVFIAMLTQRFFGR